MRDSSRNRRPSAKKLKRPSLAELIDYARTKDISDQDTTDQYEIWVESDWHDGNGKPVLNPKSTLFNYKKIRNLPSDKRNRAKPNNHTQNQPDEEDRQQVEDLIRNQHE